jgi:LPXTG-motif cell wall-anchored protein
MRKYTPRLLAALSGVVLALAGLSSPALATGGGSKPCQAYVYTGTKTTPCHEHPGPGDVNCPAIDYRVKLVGKSDPWKLDLDKDGYGCETRPPCPTPTVTPTTPPTTAPTTQPTTTAPTTTPTTAPTTTPPTTTPATTAPTTTVPTETATETETPTDDNLPLTGPSVPVIGGLAAVLLLGGLAALVFAARRRRTRFVA